MSETFKKLIGQLLERGYQFDISKENNVFCLYATKLWDERCIWEVHDIGFASDSNHGLWILAYDVALDMMSFRRNQGLKESFAMVRDAEKTFP